jgi:enoyl-CoA hydratase/carnithine racemase
MNAPGKNEVEAPYVLRADNEGIATLTLNRGERMNPLSTAMLAALQAETDRLADDVAIKVVVLAGAGKHFCAGHDLREMREHPAKKWQRGLFDQCSRVMLSLIRLPQPVIARVQGVAVAAGCQLVSMCDLAVASDAAQFALPGIKSGIFCTTPGVGVARNISRKHALEMLFTGDLIDASTALSWGLVNRVVPSPLARRRNGQARAENPRPQRRGRHHGQAVLLRSGGEGLQGRVFIRLRGHGL